VTTFAPIHRKAVAGNPANPNGGCFWVIGLTLLAHNLLKLATLLKVLFHLAINLGCEMQFVKVNFM
jgi:hypothetical protein